MGDNFYRLVCFLVNICPEPLRDRFIQLAKSDAGGSYINLDAYLILRKPKIEYLKIRKIIRDDQFDLLFPGHGTANESQWDVTLLVTLIANLFGKKIQPGELFSMYEIRDIRNILQHSPNTTNLSDTDFSSYWGRLDSAVMTIANKLHGTAHQTALKTKIVELKKICLPSNIECLLVWHENTVKEMSSTIKEMKGKLDEVQSNSQKTVSILNQVTEQMPGPGGDGDNNKKIKCFDNILKQLQASFETTISELPENFSAPPEVEDIRTRLRDTHSVVVTGSYKSRYFETALEAVTGMGYNYKRCVEMQNSYDWRHIDPEDVDFVLCKDPFGSITYDDNKGKRMADIFKSMKDKVKPGVGKGIDIMIVTDIEILKECKQLHDHDMLEQVVKVFYETSEAQPADLTSVCQRVQATAQELSKTLRGTLNAIIAPWYT